MPIAGPVARGRSQVAAPPSSSAFAWKPAKGGHDAAESFAQLQGGVAGYLGRVVEAFDLSGAVQQLGEEVGQFFLQVGCQRRERARETD